jgi:hypothetical protein
MKNKIVHSFCSLHEVGEETKGKAENNVEEKNWEASFEVYRKTEWI